VEQEEAAIARQRCANHIFAARNQPATVEELLSVGTMHPDATVLPTEYTVLPEMVVFQDLQQHSWLSLSNCFQKAFNFHFLMTDVRMLYFSS
jgi:hypothetical protein